MSPNKKSAHLSKSPIHRLSSGLPERIRTSDLMVRRVTVTDFQHFPNHFLKLSQSLKLASCQGFNDIKDAISICSLE